MSSSRENVIDLSSFYADYCESESDEPVIISPPPYRSLASHFSTSRSPAPQPLGSLTCRSQSSISQSSVSQSSESRSSVPQSSTSRSSIPQSSAAQSATCFPSVSKSEFKKGQTQHVLQFYDPKEPHGYLSNSYGTHVKRNFVFRFMGNEWPTTEHCYQALKFLPEDCPPSDPTVDFIERIRDARTPNMARLLATQKPLGGEAEWRVNLNVHIIASLEKGVERRPDWEEVKDEIMYKLVKTKFEQNPDLAKKLIDTGDAILVENSPRDTYWGAGKNGDGLNKLGQTLMRVRKELRN